MCHSGLRPGGCKLELSLCFFRPQILRFAAQPRDPDFIVGITTCHCCRAYDYLISLTCNINTYPPPQPSLPCQSSLPPLPSSIAILEPSIAILVPSIAHLLPGQIYRYIWQEKKNRQKCSHHHRINCSTGIYIDIERHDNGNVPIA
jgi:hypothetical protein